MKLSSVLCACCAALAGLGGPTAAGIVSAASGAILINEIDPDQPGTDNMEFVELFSDPANMSLTGTVVVFFNGASDTSYAAFDLDGYQTAAGPFGPNTGYFLLGNPVVVAMAGGDISFPNGTLQNGPDAVALYAADAADFPIGTAVTSTNLIDAVVYGGNDAGLLAGLGVVQSTIPSDSNSVAGSISRVPEGAFDSWQFRMLVDPIASRIPKAVGVSGDFNGNGTVDAADYVVWRKTGGSQDEYNAWQENFGRSFSIGSGSSASANEVVPEPAINILVLFAVSGLSFRRVRSRRKFRQLIGV